MSEKLLVKMSGLSLSSPVRSGSPLGLPLSSPIGSPLGSPVFRRLPLGSPLGSPVCRSLQLGSPLGSTRFAGSPTFTRHVRHSFAENVRHVKHVKPGARTCFTGVAVQSVFQDQAMTIAVDIPKLQRVSQEELERIKAFKMPDYAPPYPYKVNKFADNAKAEVYRWLGEHSLLETYTPAELQALYNADVPMTAMVGYVDCGWKELAWGAKYLFWLLIFDDRLDDITNFRSMEKSMEIFLELNMMIMWSFPDDEQLYKNFVELLEKGDVAQPTQALHKLQLKLDEARQSKPGTIYDTSPPQVHPLCKSFRDLWAPLCETMPADFLHRFAVLFQHQLLGNVTEIMNRQYKTIPSVDALIACRRNSVAMWTVHVSIEFVDKVHLPDAVFDSSEMQRFLLANNDVLTWQNDLWSFPKEALIGDVNNLVVAVSHAQDCSYTEAGEKVYQMMMNRTAEMEQAIADLEQSTPPEYQNAITRYVHFAKELYSLPADS